MENLELKFLNTSLSLRAKWSDSGTERGNPVTTREEFNYGIASLSSSCELRSLGLLAMTSYNSEE